MKKIISYLNGAGEKGFHIALDFWKQIQKEMSYRAILDNAFVNGDEDVTELVKELERTEGRKIDQYCKNLPF